MLFIQPIVSHYRKSVVEEITRLEPKTKFWGTSTYQGVAPLSGLKNVNNSFVTKELKVSNHTIVWYRKLLTSYLKDSSGFVVLSGINPYLVQTIIIFIYSKIFTSRKVYWWSQGKQFRQGILGKKLRLLLYKFSDGIFLYSKSGKSNFLIEGISEHKLHVVNNCLNYEDYGWLNYNLESEKSDSFRIIFTGRLEERKKVIILLQALSIIQGSGIDTVFLDIVGDGEQMDGLIEYVHENRLAGFVKFHGPLYGVEVHKIFLNGDIVVCPGAVGLAIVHAFSFGLPLITGEGDPEHSSELELLEVGRNGDYYLLDDYESLAETILKWKEKLEKNNQAYRDDCIESVVRHEYLPRLVAKKIVNSL